jgi:uncharacterized membrane protein YsdA (DUF1294 family)
MESGDLTAKRRPRQYRRVKYDPAPHSLESTMNLRWPLLLIAATYACLSVITFVVYAIDKSAARRKGQRTPERTLHLLSLAGGWPGALLAQRWLRHKSAKASFRRVFWVTVAVNVMGLVMLSTSFR